MKFLVVLAVVAACASAAVVSDEAQAPIVRSSSDSSPDGTSFNYAYETGNKIVAQAEGVVKNPNSENPSLEVRGSFGYVAPDGTPIETSYFADENGFQAQGAHLPTPPAPLPYPDYVVRQLQYLESHPQQQNPSEIRKLSPKENLAYALG